MTAAERLNVSPELLAALCTRYKVRELAVFGSAARGESGRDSDVDLLVVFEDGAEVGLLKLSGLQRELAHLFGRRVDLVPKDGLKPVLRDEVLAEAEVLYAA
ncbi:MAG: nucleotidyltransferase family protein [Acidobacteriota bacterium]|nr:nucleotidyltransferase family protein [Acidobacteriota bacterium]